MRSSLCLSSSLLAAALALASPARAQTPTGIPAHPDEALSETARELFAKGVQAARDQRWDQCRAAFLAAYGVKPHPQIAGNLSACEVKLGLYRDAAEHVSIFLRAQRADAPPARIAAADAVLHEASAKIATVRLHVAPEGAEALIDGKQIGNAPIVVPVFLDPGAHVLEVRQDGYVTAKRAVDAQAGSATEVALELARVPLPAPPPPPTVEKRPLWPAITAGSAAVVAFAVGGGLTGAAGAKRADAVTLGAKLGTMSGACASPPLPGAAADCQAIQQDLAGHDALNKGALGAFVVGGALAAAGVGLAVWAATGPKADQSGASSVRVLPLARRGEAGAVIAGTW